ncbi:MAG: asparaginyl-tRNA synthetase [Chloroflexia bacterium]|jgi:asparaginyl-tRNA synthetase|nr:asparaginyl-tRNA synthetase [Chloroflexia bacterium]
MGAVQPALSKSAHVARVKAAMLRAAQDTLDREGFTQVVPSMLTTMCGACGDPGTLLPVDVGGRQAYLRQTSQLHLEPLMRELGRVYSISRSFRAERRIDDRHLAEFTLVEGEAAGWNLERTMGLMERLVVGMLRYAATTASQHLTALGVTPTAQARVSSPFARMTYDEAIISLQKMGHFAEWGEDLANRHEIALTDMVGGPLFVTHYPVGTRFFTMKVRRNDPRVVECCDLLMPGVGEVMGASETEHDHDLLQARFEASASVRQWLDLGGSTSDYAWYLDMHRSESLQQAGFGLGFERLVRYGCGLKSVAEA